MTTTFMALRFPRRHRIARDHGGHRPIVKMSARTNHFFRIVNFMSLPSSFFQCENGQSL
jgi:hypothetical protein